MTEMREVKQEALHRSAEDALIYIKAAAVGAATHRAIAEAAGIEYRSAKARIRRARERGMLTPALNKRTVSDLTPLGYAILDDIHPGWREEIPKPPQIEPTWDQIRAASSEFNKVCEELDVRWEAHNPIQGEATHKVFGYRLAKAALNAGPVKRQWVKRHE